MRFCARLFNVTRNIQKCINHQLNIVNVDKYRISVKAGTGGAGISRYNGVGGHGGSVFMVGQNEIPFTGILKQLGGKYSLRSNCGETSQKTKLMGSHGRNFYLNVPIGVEAVDEDKNILIGRITRPNQRILIAKGGEGGSSQNGYKGQNGDEINIVFHLKLCPNVGLLGFPNAGKSTLLKAFIPKKSVKIAPYPFTTMKPQVGFWNLNKTDPSDPEFTLSLADLPGIVEGASRNRGKGHQFLKHLEYCDTLVMVVDINGFQLANTLNEPFRSALETVALLNIELENYDRKLTHKPVVLVLNKTDILKNPEECSHLKSLFSREEWHSSLPSEMHPRNPLRFDYVIPCVAKSGEIDEVKRALSRLHRSLKVYEVPEDLITSEHEKFFV